MLSLSVVAAHVFTVIPTFEQLIALVLDFMTPFFPYLEAMLFMVIVFFGLSLLVKTFSPKDSG